MVDSAIQLGNLDHADIKQSIIDFIKSQDSGPASSLKDYNFEGAALNTLLDILAYNTLYYGFYTNMVANEIFLDTAQKTESLVSLVKPLGYVVPGYSSSVAEIKIDKGGANRFIPKYSSFIGRNEVGASYIFYTLEDYNLDDQGDVNARIYEGKNLVVKEGKLDNQSLQKIFLSGLDIEIASITVEVKTEEETEYEEWSYVSNTVFDINENSKVFWVERSDLGFYIVFGGRPSAGDVENLGRRVEANDIVRVTYLVSSGSNANGVNSFTYRNLYGTDDSLSTNNEIVTLSPSSEGSEEPDLESIRFFAPKWFAAQDRAVTKDDCKAILGQGVGDEDGFTPDQISIWGGEEMIPPMYGRLFVSLLDKNPDGTYSPATTESAVGAIQKLKTKTVVGILPEYVPAENYNVNINMNVNFKSGESNRSESQLRSLILSYANEQIGKTKFLNTINLNTLLTGIVTLDPSFYSFNLSNTSVNVSKSIEPSNSTISVSFGNEIDSDNNQDGKALSSTTIESDRLGSVLIENYGNDIRAYTINNGIKNVVDSKVGSINYTTGLITLKPFFDSSFLLRIRPKNATEIVAKNQMLLNASFNLNLNSE